MYRPFVFALVLAASATQVVGATPAGEPGEHPDKRQILELPPDERHLVLKEMRNFVLAIKEINEGLAAKEMADVTRAARRMGSNAASAIPREVVKKLPDPFKRMAGKVHNSFDRIALDAEAMGDRGLPWSSSAASWGNAWPAMKPIRSGRYPMKRPGDRLIAGFRPEGPATPSARRDNRAAGPGRSPF